MRRLFATIIILMLIVSTQSSLQRQTAKKMTGLWEERSVTMSAITLRKDDGTYRRKQIQLYDYAKPALSDESAGHWKVIGKHYIFDLQYVSTPIWRKDIGKQWKVTILKNEARLFKYRSTDGATVEERKIGDASDAAFE